MNEIHELILFSSIQASNTSLLHSKIIIITTYDKGYCHMSLIIFKYPSFKHPSWSFEFVLHGYCYPTSSSIGCCSWCIPDLSAFVDALGADQTLVSQFDHSYVSTACSRASRKVKQNKRFVTFWHHLSLIIIR